MNQIAHHLYLYALSLELLGDKIATLRAVSVLFGVATVAVAYLFGREYGGRGWGLLLAFLVASMRWHVNFSRIAMNGIDAPFFIFLSLYFALRVLRGGPGQLRAIAALGLSLGLGLNFYTALRFFLVASIVFGLVLLIVRLHSRRRARQPRQPTGNRSWLSPTICVGLLLVAVWLAAMPTVQYARRHSDSFFGRARRVSIFEPRQDPNLARTLAQNTQKHLLMFNYKGDNNGCHNLPGVPTLDRFSAVLFAFGVGLAVARRDPVGLFFICLLLAGLLGSILTLDLEAPQSLRSIGALPAVVFFIALSLDVLWLDLRRDVSASGAVYHLVPVFLALGIIAFSNGLTYFGPQAHNPTVWAEFSAAETLVGKHIVEHGPDSIYYFSPLFFDHTSIRFHAPEESHPGQRKVIPLPDPWPVREAPNQSVVYFIHPDEEWVFSQARQIYPTAQLEILPAEPEYPPA
jgi:4-amino-4-deoxy-L-arabinose transferase-like glycosyltransferase